MPMPRHRLRVLLAAFLAALPALSLAAPPGALPNNGSPAYPFPINATYPYGIRPNHKTAAAFAADCQSMYTMWYNNAVTDSGAGGTAANGVVRLRVYRNTNGSDTVSEGMGYGMLIAVMMGDKRLLDSLWTYAKQHIPDSIGNYVMDWQINSGNSVAGQNGATDADEDMCMALLLAHKQWGSAGVINYQSEFNSMATAIWNKEIANTGDFHVKPGDAWDGTLFSSYMCPAWYRCWPSFESSPHAWNNAVNWVYNTFYKTLITNYPKGYKPETTSSSINPITTSHGYDASRYGWRTGQDYLWNGDANAQANTGAMANSVFAGGISNIKEYWDIGSGAASGSNNSLQVGPALVACMGQTSQQTFVNSLYDEMVNNRYAKPSFTYFQDSLCMIAELVATGNFPNLACGAVGPSNTSTATPVNTPSRTPTPSATLTPTPTPVPPPASKTMTPSLTTSLSASASFTPTAVTPLPTTTRSETATFSPVSAAGPVKVGPVLGLPDPNPGRLAVWLEGVSGPVDLRLYTAGMVCVWDVLTQPQGQGWNYYLLPPEIRHLPNGEYYAVVKAQGGKAVGKIYRVQ